MPATVLAALPATLLAALASLGHDAAAIRARAGLSEDELGDPDGRIPFAAHLRLWEEIAALGGTVGIDLGERIGLRAMGVVGHVMSHAESVAEAWQAVERYRRLVLEDALPRLHVEDGADGRVARFVQPLPPRVAALRHPAECQASATLTALRVLAGDRTIAPRRLSLPHAAPADAARHHALFGTRAIEFRAPVNEMVLDAAILARPIARADPALRDYLVRRADALTRDLGDAEPLADRARRAILDALTRGEPSAEKIARALGTSARTLHRRLKEEHTGLSTLLEEIRRERALAMLAEPSRRVGEVAYALGYRDASAFSRAFRRWTGEAPEAWRDRRPGR